MFHPWGAGGGSQAHTGGTGCLSGHSGCSDGVKKVVLSSYVNGIPWVNLDVSGAKFLGSVFVDARLFNENIDCWDVFGVTIFLFFDFWVHWGTKICSKIQLSVTPAPEPE